MAKAKDDDPALSNLFKEIDEEIRQDKATALWKQYGNSFIGVIIALVLAVAGYEGWKAYDQSARQNLGDQFEQGLSYARLNQYDQAQQVFQSLAGNNDTGYSVLAQMQEAGLLARQGKGGDAANAYFLIAQNGEINATFRDMALILGALNGLDVLEADEIIRRLEPMVSSANPWRFSAMEISAYAQAKAGNLERARELMTSLLDDATAPAGIRQRAREFAQAYAG